LIAADWDATKAKNIAATVIQQHPDLCAITGFWDVMDVGTAAAIKESGKNVYLLTQGGGNRMVCNGLANGTYSESVVYFVPGQARDMATMIKQLLQLKQPAGTTKTTLFTPLTFLRKDNMTAASCWDMPTKG
jgi:ABC-type sugar transport system substrate-binding protein